VDGLWGLLLRGVSNHSGPIAQWNAASGTLLEFAEKLGISMASGGRVDNAEAAARAC
jgi:hypothetical protein